MITDPVSVLLSAVTTSTSGVSETKGITNYNGYVVHDVCRHTASPHTR